MACGLRRGASEYLRLLGARLRALPALDGLVASTSCPPPSISGSLHALQAHRWAHTHISSNNSGQHDGAHLMSTLRHFGAAPQLEHYDEDEAEEAHREYDAAALAQRQASHSHASTRFAALPAADADSGADSGSSSAGAPWEQQGTAQTQAWPDDSLPPTEGEVYYGQGSLYHRMRQHYEQLQVTLPSYTARVSFDEFGARYVEQIKREEEARGKALRRELARVAAAESTGGQDGYRPAPSGAIARKLVDVWLPLLTQAIQQEQQEILEGAGDRKNGRDKYGPYFQWLDAEEMALLTIQTVLSLASTTITREAEYMHHLDPEAQARNHCGAPAVLLADTIGRAVNDRVKLLRWNHKTAAELARRRQQQREQQQQQGLRRARRGARQGQQEQEQEQQQALQLAGVPDAPTGPFAPGPQTVSKLGGWQQGVLANAAKFDSACLRLGILKGKVLRRGAKKTIEAAINDASWGIDTRIKVGAALLALLVENSPVPVPGRRKRGAPVTEPAFDYHYQQVGIKRQAFIHASMALCDMVGRDDSLRAALLSRCPPMLVPPRPWVSYKEGGYLTMRHWMMRTRWSAHIKDALTYNWDGSSNGSGRGGGDGSSGSDGGGDSSGVGSSEGAESGGRRPARPPLKYQAVLDALNVLGNTSWCMNTPVLDVMEALWQSKAATGVTSGLPSQEVPRYPPPPPTTYRLCYADGALHARSGPPTHHEQRNHILARDDTRKRKRNLASLKADFELKLGVARELRDAPEFYYPHTLDFRGRAYPLHPSLQHLGDDCCRGLLRFGEGRPLGERGLDWLYVHLANVWGHGYDKRSFDGRRKFAKEHLPDILSSAHAPLTHTWWTEAEKPWQTLAACFEISGALGSLDPASYVSRLPVHMDGSCNGLQHYAALGRDAVGGKAVNLTPSDSPQDVYSGVAAIVARKVDEDAARGVGDAMRLKGHVDRKLVKQTVMTSVYGVTHVGARAQVEARLRERNWGDGDVDTLWSASKYAADLTLDALGEMFGSAKHIMAWLADCARIVASSGQPVCWTNPMGLPIAQPYHRSSTISIPTLTQRFNVQREGSDRHAAVTKTRQRSAFPPNYIHSIDSAHMMRTAIACQRLGVTFAGVHDSFWTHAGTVCEMNRALREEFVALHHDAQLLHDLRDQLQAQHPHLTFPPVPETGSLDIRKVRQSRYFFS